MTITERRSLMPFAKPVIGALGVSALLLTAGCGAGTSQGVYAQPW